MSGTTGNLAQRAALEAIMKVANNHTSRQVHADTLVRIPLVRHFALRSHYERNGSRLVRRMIARIYAATRPG